jgi:hypothetical protein
MFSAFSNPVLDRVTRTTLASHGDLAHRSGRLLLTKHTVCCAPGARQSWHRHDAGKVLGSRKYSVSACTAVLLICIVLHCTAVLVLVLGAVSVM